MNRPTLSTRRYRYLDRITKLGGVGLVAAGLEAGGATSTGLILGICGTVIATCTVFIHHQ